jgi:hypothetical protein
MAESPSDAVPPPAATPPTGAQAPSAAALNPADPLAALNQAFREAYAARREALFARLGPVIAQLEDVLILRRGDERLVGPARTRRYHELKAISHLPLALHMLLAGRHGALEEEARGQLTRLQQLARSAAAGLEGRGLPPEVLARQHRLLAASLGFIDSLLAQGHLAPGALPDFIRAQTPDLLQNAEDAARDQIETMHATVEAWKQRMTPAERARLRAVVSVSHMSRPGNVALQYFSLTLGETWEGRFDQEDLQPGKRVLASETATDEASAFGLLATQDLDARVAHRFFGEEARMERDLLADAAERILARMFRREPEPPAPPAT